MRGPPRSRFRQSLPCRIFLLQFFRGKLWQKRCVRPIASQHTLASMLVAGKWADAPRLLGGRWLHP
jgi:hypothetical protein